MCAHAQRMDSGFGRREEKGALRHRVRVRTALFTKSRSSPSLGALTIATGGKR